MVLSLPDELIEECVKNHNQRIRERRVLTSHEPEGRPCRIRRSTVRKAQWVIHYKQIRRRLW